MLNRDEFRTSFQASIDDTICTFNIEDLMGADGQVTKSKQKMVLKHFKEFVCEVQTLTENARKIVLGTYCGALPLYFLLFFEAFTMKLSENSILFTHPRVSQLY